MTDMKKKRNKQKEGWQLYQELCDRVFGKGAVEIYPAPENNVLRSLFQVPGFKIHLEERLKKLRERMQGQPEYHNLLRTVALAANVLGGDEAYAKLAAWDVLWYETEYHLEGLDALGIAPMEDEELDVNRVRPILWHYNPYQMAEQTKDLIRKKFGHDIKLGNTRIVVLVRLPWVSDENRYFEAADYEYFRAMARRAFVTHEDGGPVKGGCTAADVARKLGGIIIIDEGWKEGMTFCHAFKNPNSEVRETEEERFTLIDAPDEGDLPGVYEDFEHDNY